MTSLLNVTVSRFDSYRDIIAKPVNLLNWLQSDRYAHKVIALRKMTDKAKRDKIKATLPAVTVSGFFDPHRRTDHLIRHSGLLCIDIDRKDNLAHNIVDLKHMLFEWPYVAYAGLSVSGQGIFLIVPIARPADQTGHFHALEHDFRKRGAHIDKAPKSVVSLRGYSWDPEALFRHDADVYCATLDPKRVKRKKTFKPIKPSRASGDTQSRVERLVQTIMHNRVDITGSEPDWFRIACALANEFGERGRMYFHQISQFHPAYDVYDANRKYDQVSKGKYSRIGIGTLFSIADHHLSGPFFDAPAGSFSTPEETIMDDEPF